MVLVTLEPWAGIRERLWRYSFNPRLQFSERVRRYLVRTLGSTFTKHESTLKGFRSGRTLSGLVVRNRNVIPWFSLHSNHGLEFANAFGVIPSIRGCNLANACGVIWFEPWDRHSPNTNQP